MLLLSCFATGVYAPVWAVARRLVRRLAESTCGPADEAGRRDRQPDYTTYTNASPPLRFCAGMGQQLAAVRLRLDNLLIKQSILGYPEPGVNHTKGELPPTCGYPVIREGGRG